MPNFDGTEAFDLDTFLSKMDTVSLWHGITLPTNLNNQIPTNGLFLKTDTGVIYENTGTLASPTWTKITSEGDGQTGDQLYPLNNTIGSYASPSAAVSSSDANPDPDHTDNYSNDNYTDSGTAFGVSGGELDWKLERELVDNYTYRDIMGATVSDTKWFMRFKWVVNNFTGSSAFGTYCWFLMDSITGGTGNNRDALGFSYHNSSSQTKITIADSDGADVDQGVIGGWNGPTSAVTRYVEMERISATSFRIEFYSDATFTTSTGSQTLTIPSTIQNLRYFKLVTWNLATATWNGTVDGVIDDLQFWDGKNKSDAVGASSAPLIDDDTNTNWKSESENNPNAYFDMGSNKELAGVAINLDRTNTTETELEIRVSTDTTFSTSERVRTILVSDFTDDTWRFISIPRLEDDRRYFQIYGKSNSVVLSINEVKYLAVTNWDRKHYHKHLDPIDTGSNSEDSN